MDFNSPWVIIGPQGLDFWANLMYLNA
jgi:hypothetical protein